MKGNSFSTQYLKQVQDEWLYVLAVRERKQAAANDPEARPVSYSCCVLGNQDRQVSRQWNQQPA